MARKQGKNFRCKDCLACGHPTKAAAKCKWGALILWQEWIEICGRNNGRSMSLPPKVRTFTWRACSNILPTRDNLQRKKVRIEEWCGLCDHSSETASHILWECPFATKFWTLVRVKLQKSPASIKIYSCWSVRGLFARLEKKDLEVWASVSWAIWNARNKFYFDKVQTPPRTIMENVVGLLDEYQRLMTARRQS